MKTTIENKETGEICEISRSVTDQHPAWVHEQLGTNNESDLQSVMDAYNVSDFYTSSGKHKGADEAGVSLIGDYVIRYNHTSSEEAEDYSTALDMVRTQMLPQKDVPVEIEVEDGTYIYRNQEDADEDDTGASAFAVILAPHQQ